MKVLYSHPNPRVFKLFYVSGTLHCIFWSVLSTLSYNDETLSKRLALSKDSQMKASIGLVGIGVAFLAGAHFTARRQITRIVLLNDKVGLQTGNMLGKRYFEIEKDTVRTFSKASDLDDKLITIAGSGRKWRIDKSGKWANATYFDKLFYKNEQIS